jgi:hypothetical protein
VVFIIVVNVFFAPLKGPLLAKTLQECFVNLSPEEADYLTTVDSSTVTVETRLVFRNAGKRKIQITPLSPIDKCRLERNKGKRDQLLKKNSFALPISSAEEAAEKLHHTFSYFDKFKAEYTPKLCSVREKNKRRLLNLLVCLYCVCGLRFLIFFVGCFFFRKLLTTRQRIPSVYTCLWCLQPPPTVLTLAKTHHQRRSSHRHNHFVSKTKTWHTWTVRLKNWPAKRRFSRFPLEAYFLQPNPAQFTCQIKTVA